jgi:hypothetical protein
MSDELNGITIENIGDPAPIQHTPEEALEMLLVLAIRGVSGPAPGTLGHDEWWQSREGRIVSGLYNDLNVGMLKDERTGEQCDEETEELDELTLQFYGGGEGE